MAKAQPAALKLVKGRHPGVDSGGRPLKHPPAFKRIPPSPPSWLGVAARAEWDRVVPELERLNLLKELDAVALASYCEMVDLFITATAQVHESGLVVENRSLRKDGTESVWFTANPAVTVQRNAQAAIRSWCSEFGLTPAAEMKLATETSDGGNDEGSSF